MDALAQLGSSFRRSREQLRTSSYCIFVDLPKRPGRVLLVHGYVGSYDEVSSDVADFLKCKRPSQRYKPLHGEWVTDLQEPERRPNISQDTIVELERRGYLTKLTLDEEREVLRSIAARVHSIEMERRSYIIVPSYDCNLRCPYCFQDYMRTDPSYRHLLHGMTPELADRILAGIEHLEAKADPARPREISSRSARLKASFERR